MRKFKILSRERVLTYKPSEKHYNVMIRITEPGKAFEKIEYEEKYAEILELYFEDYTKEQVVRLREKFPQRTITIIEKSHAKKILKFFKKHKNADLLVVHCEAGVSRSAGVAVAWCEFRGDLDGERYIRECGLYLPNQTVVDFILGTFN